VPLLALSPKVAPPNTNEEPIETSEVKAVENSLAKTSPRTSIGKEEGKYTRPQVADGENFVRYVDETAQSSMLISAAANNQLSLMKELFALGVTPNSTDYDKRSALHVACAVPANKQILFDSSSICANCISKEPFVIRKGTRNRPASCSSTVPT